MANLAALRAAVFSLSAKNLRGGGGADNRPPAVRGLKLRVNESALNFDFFLRDHISKN